MYQINFRINVTECCNFNCDYCIEKSQQAKNRYSDFDINKSIELLEKTLDRHKDRKIFVSFFGGEPTLKKDKIMEFLQIIKNKDYFKDLRFEITTNAYIFFPEIIEFCHKYKKPIKIMISYDAIGQSFRNKDETINSQVKNNIIKYIKLMEKLEMNTSMISANCCVVEDNADTIFNSFIDITDKGLEIMKFSTVFCEHWKTESFEKLYKSFKDIYNFIIRSNRANKRIKYKIPIIDGSHREHWKKFNSLYYQTKNDKDFIKKIDVSEIYYSEIIERRYKNKIHYSIKPIVIDKDIRTVEDIELLTLRYSSFNYTYFDKLTMVLLLGDNAKKYKHEIYSLFNFDRFLCNKYIKAIKRKINETEINVFNFFKKYKYTNYLIREYGKERTNEIVKKLDTNLSYMIIKNKIIINNEMLELNISKNNSYIKEVIKNIMRKILLDNCSNIDVKVINLISENFYMYIYEQRIKNKEVVYGE